MNSKAGTFLNKFVVLIVFSVLILIPFQNCCSNVEAVETSSNTRIFIKIHDWQKVSVNNSEETVEITGVAIEDVREQIDYLGNRNGEVEKWEVLSYSQGLEMTLNSEFEENQDKDTHIFQMLIDGFYGTFNRTSVYFKGLEGLVTSTASVIFAIEIFLDYTKTDLTKPSHKIQLNIGEIFAEEQSFFSSIKLSLPNTWAFNTTVIPPDFPILFYEKNTLLNVTKELYAEHFAVGEFLRMNGLTIEKASTIPPNGGHPNGDNGQDGKDDEGLLNLWLLAIIIFVIAVIAVIIIFTVQRRKK